MSKTLLLLFVLFSLTFGFPISQLVDERFPDRWANSRKYTKDKRLFKAYRSQPMIIILSPRDAISADLYINGKKVPVKFRSSSLSPTADIHINITDYLKDEVNTFSIKNIQPSKGAYINAYVPYPELNYGDPASVGVSPELLQKVDDLINSEIKGGFPGATLVIAKKGKIIKEEAYGCARKYNDDGTPMDRCQPMKKDTMFDLGSITKIFATLFGMMKLHNDNLINYKNTVQKYMDDYKGVGGYDRSKVLVFDILTHTAGYSKSLHFYDDKGEFYSRDKKMTREHICSRVPLTTERGGVPKYNDVNYILAGLLIEDFAKMDLNEYTRRFFYSPLKLQRTTFAPLKKGFYKEDTAATEITGNTRNGTKKFKDIRKTVIQGEVQDENAYYSMNEIAGHAGLFSTAKELAILSQVILNQGGYGDDQFWSKNTQDFFVKPYDKSITYGVGWKRQGNEGRTTHFGAYASNLAIGHLGSTGTAFVIDPAHDLIIVLLTNKQHTLYINGKHQGEDYQTAKQGSIMQLIYESFLN